MKLKKRILPLALAGLMTMSCLAGCGGASSDSAAENNADTSSSTAAGSETSTGEPVEATYPLRDETATISIYMKDPSNGAVGDWSEMKGMKAAAEKLGVEIEFITPAVGSEADQFNLMIASGEYPDVILWDYRTTPMSLNEMVDAGVLIDADSYIRQYAPNYLKVLEENENFEKEALSDDGHYLAMYAFSDVSIVSGGPAIRKDVLDKYGLEVPTTVDDWTEVFATLKEQDPDIQYPLTDGKGRDGSVWFCIPMTAYKTSNIFCLDDETGEVVYGPSTDNFKEYLAKLNEWYEAGYIDPEFMSNDGTSMNAKLTDGRSVAGTNMQLSYHIGNITTAARETNPDFEFVGCPWPVLNEGDEPSYYMPNGIAYSGKQAAITSACEDPALAVQILDFFYSEEGEDLLTWGIEGESYQVNEDGTKSFTDNIMNNPDGKNPQEAIIEYATPQYNFANVMMEEPYVEIITTLPEQREARNTWLDAVDGVNLPYLTVDPDVQSDYTMLMNDITTYVQETYIQFITGQVDLESGWESYVNTLNGMGLETATQYMADAYALYQQR